MQSREAPPTAAEAEAIARLEAFARDLLPSHTRHPFSELHRYLFLRRVRKLAQSLESRRGQIDVVLAPRGAAKSTVLGLIFPIHALVHRLERHILILSATRAQARMRLQGIRSALRESATLGRAWPVLGTRWRRNNADSIEIDGVRIDAFSGASELRGLSHGAWRPTWIILDDIEDGRRVGQPEYREKLSNWLHEVIDHLGDGYTNIDLIGTLLHTDALPRRMAERPDVRFRLFKSIESEAVEEGLWRRWENVVRGSESGDGIEEARRYFEARRDAMLRGTRVLWPEKEDYPSLRLLRLTLGATAFNKEKQNLPPVAGGGYFNLELLRRFTLMGEAVVPVETGVAPGAPDDAVVSLRDLSVFGFLDPARGRAGGASAGSMLDFAAIATVGMDRDGRLFVLDVWLERAPASRQILKAFDLHARWRYVRFGIEANAFQSMLLEQLEHERNERRKRAEPSDLPAHGIERHESKQARIIRLEGRISAGRIFFSRDLPEEFIRQLEAFPGGRHDDGPDAVEGAIGLALEGRRLDSGLTGVRPSSRRGRSAF